MNARPDLWSRARQGIRLLFALLMIAATLARAQEGAPGRVGRLADFGGEVSMYDQEQGAWSPALRNRPLTTGDRVSTPRDGRAELRIGSTTLRLGGATEFEVVRLDDERLRFRLLNGNLALRVRSREVAAEIEIETDEARLRPLRGGHFRIDRQDGTTFAASWRGELRVEAGNEGFDIEPGRRVELWREGPGRTLVHAWTTPLDDAFAAWVVREDGQDDRSVSTRYVSPETTGIEDLDRNGRWEPHPEYGAVWFPLVVVDDWAPYRFGHWAWVRPWGWTWVDDARWGFAPFHYGRWIYWRQRWGWVPGPIMSRPVFAPALVAWVGGPRVAGSIQVGGPTLGWVPLSPREVYRPTYPVLPRHRDHDDRPPGQGGPHDRGQGAGGPVMYTNQGVPGGITVVPASVLEQQRQPVPVGRHAVRDESVVRDMRRQPVMPTQPLVQPSNAGGPISTPAPVRPAEPTVQPAAPAERTLVEPVPRRSRADGEPSIPRGRVPAEGRPHRPEPSERTSAPPPPAAPMPNATPAAVAPPPARATTPATPPPLPVVTAPPARTEVSKPPPEVRPVGPAAPKDRDRAPAAEEGRGKGPIRERGQPN